MTKIKFMDLTLDNLYMWPILIKKIAIATICFFIFIIGWILDTRHLFHQLEIEKNNGLALQKEVLIKQKKSAEINFNPQKLMDLKKKMSLVETSGERHKEPLEFFPIASLQVLGIIKKSNIRWALITAKPSQTLYQITKGSYIGSNNGRVIAITDNVIEILELVPDSEGLLEEKRVFLTLPGT